MTISRREFLYGTITTGVASAAAGVFAPSAFAARRNAAGEGQAELFKKFDGNLLVLPGKYSGVVQVMDLSVPETLAWYEYGLAGIDMAIPHHVAALPSADPYKGFDFYQSMQPPMAPYINENSPEWRDRGDFKMYKMRYDGSGPQNQISIVNDISVTTGMALGVHVSIGVGENAKKYVAFADGQKDLVLITTIDDNPKIVKAMRFDCDHAARQVTVSHVFPDFNTGKFNYQGRLRPRTNRCSAKNLCRLIRPLHSLMLLLGIPPCLSVQCYCAAWGAVQSSIRGLGKLSQCFRQPKALRTTSLLLSNRAIVGHLQCRQY